MRLIALKSITILIIMLFQASTPISAFLMDVGADGGTGPVSASGQYYMDDSASLQSDISMGGGVLSRQSSSFGDSNNVFSEGMSGGGSSVSNMIASQGSLSVSTNDMASGSGVASSYQASLAGGSGSIFTSASGDVNEMMVAAGFAGMGNMDVSLSTLAAEEAMTSGSISALGTQCFSDDLAQGVRGQDAAVSVHGIYQAGDKGLGEFGVVVQNAKPGGAALKPQPSTKLYYKLTGWRWDSDVNHFGPSIPITISGSESDLPVGIAFESVRIHIGAAMETWDKTSQEHLFSAVGEAPDTANRDYSEYDIQDQNNVHLWTKDIPLKSGVIAMTVTWYGGTDENGDLRTVEGDDGTVYYEAVESDCWYNNNFNWRITDAQSGTFDIQTIALHELGHTLGLADLYIKPASSEVMYGYNSGNTKRSLGGGDIAGITKLYGV